MNANEKQVGGLHYVSSIQHWDYVAANNLDYFQGQITKYVARWKNKNGLQDLEKAKHFLEKYIELNTSGPMDTCTCGAERSGQHSHLSFCDLVRAANPGASYVDPDR